MFKSRIAKLAQWLVLGACLSQFSAAETYVNLGQAVPTVVFKSVNLGHANPNQLIHLNINVAPANPGAMSAYANAVSNPKSPLYRKFLRPEEVGAKFGMNNVNFSKVLTYLQGNGFTIRLASKNHLNIMADAPVSRVEAAFKTTINNYQTLDSKDPENQRFYSYAKVPQVPISLQGIVRSVSGLQNHTKGQKKTTLTPSQTRTLYNSLPIFTAGYQGQGRNVAISSFDGFLLSNVPVFITTYGLPTPSGGAGSNITVVPIDGGSGAGTAQGEADLDIQMVIGQAPLCNFKVYDGGGPLIDVLTQETNDNWADIISESYGWNLTTEEGLACHNQHLSMTLQGITYMEATGDYGTALDPYSYSNYEPEVLQVGGTVATVDSSGNRQQEQAWSGSGGGWSTKTDAFNTLPVWQVGPGVPVGNNHRLNPDVALHADGGGSGAYDFVFAGAVNTGYSGTSFASPVFAGSLAIVEQKLIALNSLPGNGYVRARFGRIQDLIYAQQGRPDVWYDITSGPTTGVLPDGTSAVPTVGWDYTTGWGSINFDAFVAAVATPPVTVAASSVSVYTGNRLTGDKVSLIAVDGNTYDVATSEFPGYGQMAGIRLGYTLPVAPSKVLTLVLDTTSSSNDLATTQFFVLNVNTGSYDLIKSVPGAATQTENKFEITPVSNYVSAAGTVNFVVRSMAPDRLATGGFVFSTDQAILTLQSSP